MSEMLYIFYNRHKPDTVFDIIFESQLGKIVRINFDLSIR